MLSHARYPTERVPQNPFSDCFMTKFSLAPRSIRTADEGMRVSSGIMRPSRMLGRERA